MSPPSSRPAPTRRERSGRPTAALLVYVIILVAFQVFLLTVAVEAFQTDEAGLAWATAGVSVVLAGGAVALVRYLRP